MLQMELVDIPVEILDQLLELFKCDDPFQIVDELVVYCFWRLL